MEVLTAVRRLAGCLLMLVSAGVPWGFLPGHAAEESTAPIAYTLVHGSHLIEDCPPCGRPTLVEPMRGGFLWQFVSSGPSSSQYELSRIDFTAGFPGGRVYRITGRGTCVRTHTVPPTQQAVFEVVIDNGVDRSLCVLTNTRTASERQWPMLDLPLVQTNGTFSQVYHLQVYAAPFHDLWFSTPGGLTSSRWNPPTNQLNSGDLLSFRGTVARRNAQLTLRLGILPQETDPGLDAAGPDTNGALAFSMQRDVFSSRYGWIRHGDLVSETGRLLRRNSDLYAAFLPRPGVGSRDYGLDAVHILASGEVWFSTPEDFFSDRLGRMVRRGDLLSELGAIVRTQESLLEQFRPPLISEDNGLDAVHVWPSGEVWFSLERGFLDARLGPIGSGDLLSDRGYIVYRNLELVAPFSPLEDLADFGLDAVLAFQEPPDPNPPADEPPPVTYQLIDGSRLADELSPGSGTIVGTPMRGSFRLEEIRDGIFTGRYAVQEIAFTARTPQGRTYSVQGHGTLRVAGFPAPALDAEFELILDDGRNRRLCYFTNAPTAEPRLWPMIQLTLNQANPVPGQYYQLVVSAAPFEELWISTRQGFQPGPVPVTANPPAPVTGGDLLSSSGRVVKRNHELTARLGFMPPVPDLGLDALELRPAGGLGFSIETDQFSETLGPIHDGDLVTDRGAVIRYTRLLAEFDPEPPIWDEGLDAAHSTDSADGEVFFSVKKDFDSQRLGKRVRRGDLLSSRGIVFRTNEQLLARFEPAFANRDYGLDAVWIWPSGEIWFSTEDGFLDGNLDTITAGDILSNQGYVVYRNRELLARFSPTGDVRDYGLDALAVITDPGSTLPAPRITVFKHDPEAGSAFLRWAGPGSVFHVERATLIEGPYEGISGWIPDLEFTDSSAPPAGGFYRVRQW